MMKSSRLRHEVCVTSTKWELRLYFDVCISPMNECRISTSDEVRISKAIWLLRLQDLCSVFTSTISSTVHWDSTPTTSSEHWGGLDCVSRHSRWSFLVASKSLSVHSRRPRSRRDQAQGISINYQSSLKSLLPKEKSKVFQNPSQSTVEF